MTDFKAKVHQIRFRLGLRRRPRWGLTTLPGQTPYLELGAASRQGGLGWGRGGKGEGGEVEGTEREGPQVTVEPARTPTPLSLTDRRLTVVLLHKTVVNSDSIFPSFQQRVFTKDNRN